MQEYQIPKIQSHVEVHLESGKVYKGSFYLSTNNPQFSGPQRLEDFFEQDKEFLPMHLDDDTFRFINKHHVTFLISDEKDRAHLENDLALSATLVDITFSDGSALSGEAFPDMPEGRRRASDFFNQTATFLPLYQGDQKLIINKASVLFFRETE